METENWVRRFFSPPFFSILTHVWEYIAKSFCTHSYLKQAALKLRDNFNSDVPKTVDELCSLPGVGPKMAFLALQIAWGLNHGIGVDVHVHRITNLLGWHKPPTINPEQTRCVLMLVVVLISTLIWKCLTYPSEIGLTSNPGSLKIFITKLITFSLASARSSAYLSAHVAMSANSVGRGCVLVQGRLRRVRRAGRRLSF